LPSRNRTTDDIFLIFNFPYFPSNQTNYIYQELASKLKNLGKKKKTHTCERDLVLGPVVAEVFNPLAGHAPLEAKQLLPRATRNLLDPLYTDVGCFRLVENLISIYRQLMAYCKNQIGIMGE
jgi:hypothetical protein